MRRADNLYRLQVPIGNLGASTSWNPQGLSRPVRGFCFTFNLHTWCITFLNYIQQSPAPTYNSCNYACVPASVMYWFPSICPNKCGQITARKVTTPSILIIFILTSVTLASQASTRPPQTAAHINDDFNRINLTYL